MCAKIFQMKKLQRLRQNDGCRVVPMGLRPVKAGTTSKFFEESYVPCLAMIFMVWPKIAKII